MPSTSLAPISGTHPLTGGQPVAPDNPSSRTSLPDNSEMKPWHGPEGRARALLYPSKPAARSAQAIGAGNHPEIFLDLAYEKLLLIKIIDDMHFPLEETEAAATPEKPEIPFDRWQSEQSMSLNKYLSHDWKAAFEEPRTIAKNAIFAVGARIAAELVIKGLHAALDRTAGKPASIVDALPSGAELFRCSVDGAIAAALFGFKNLNPHLERAYAQVYQDLCKKSAGYVKLLPGEIKEYIEELDAQMLMPEVLSLKIGARNNFMIAVAMRVDYLSVPLESLDIWHANNPQKAANTKKRIEDDVLPLFSSDDQMRIAVLLNQVRLSSAKRPRSDGKEKTIRDDISIDGLSDSGQSANNENFWIAEGELDRLPAIYLHGPAEYALMTATKLPWALGFPEEHIHVLHLDRYRTAYDLMNHMYTLFRNGGINNPAFIFVTINDSSLSRSEFVKDLEDLFKNRLLFSTFLQKSISISHALMIWVGSKSVTADSLKKDNLGSGTLWVLDQLAQVAVPAPKREIKQAIADATLDAKLSDLQGIHGRSHAEKVGEKAKKYLPNLMSLFRSISDITVLKAAMAEVPAYISTKLERNEDVTKDDVEEYLKQVMEGYSGKENTLEHYR